MQGSLLVRHAWQIFVTLLHLNEERKNLSNFLPKVGRLYDRRGFHFVVQGPLNYLDLRWQVVEHVG